MTEEQREEMDAAMYYIKYSEDGKQAADSARFILNGYMNASGIKRILQEHQSDTLNNIGNAGLQEEATSVALGKVDDILAQLFVNTFRMGMLDSKNSYDLALKNIEESKESDNIIGEPHSDE